MTSNRNSDLQNQNAGGSSWGVDGYVPTSVKTSSAEPRKDFKAPVIEPRETTIFKMHPITFVAGAVGVLLLTTISVIIYTNFSK